MSNTEIFHILKSEDGRRIYPLLTEYASWCAGGRRLPKGFEAEDLAGEAIASLLNGQRRWNSEKIPDLLCFLKGVIDSKLSHLFESLECRKLYNASHGDGERQEEQVDANQIDPQDELEAKELKGHLWKQAEGDEEIGLVLLCLEDGMERREMAEELGWPPEKVDNVRKRIKRICLKFLRS